MCWRFAVLAAMWAAVACPSLAASDAGRGDGCLAPTVASSIQHLKMPGAAWPQELDVDAEMQRGLLPGAIALSGKFGPAVRGVAQRSAEAVRTFVADPAAFSDRVRRGLV